MKYYIINFMFYIIIVLNRPQFFFYFSPFFLHYLFIYIFILWKTINLVHYKNISFKYIKIINKVFFFQNETLLSNFQKFENEYSNLNCLINLHKFVLIVKVWSHMCHVFILMFDFIFICPLCFKIFSFFSLLHLIQFFCLVIHENENFKT